VQDSSKSVEGDLFETQEDRESYSSQLVMFRVNNRGFDVTGCFKIKVRSDTAEFADMRIAGLRK